MRARTAALLSTALLVALTACGGGDDGASTGERDATSTSAPVEGGAELRVVNLFASDGAGAAIDVYPAPDAAGGSPAVENVAYGEVSEFVSVASDGAYSLYRAGETSPDAQLASASLAASPGDRITLLATADSHLGPGARITSYLDEAPDPTLSPDNPDPDAELDLPAGNALVVGNAAALLDVLPEDADPGELGNTFQFGAPGVGCHERVSFDAGYTVGGTNSVLFVVPTGEVTVASYGWDDVSCSGEVQIPAVNFEAPQDSRTYVFAYGTGPDDLDLLVVPAERG